MTYRKNYILLLGILISLAVIGSTLAAPNFGVPIRALLAFPFVFFLPGFALITVIAPRYHFRSSEQILLSLGLSIMISIFSTFLLNLILSGLTNENWAIMLGGLTLIGCSTAIARLRTTQADQSIYVNLGLSVRQMILLGLSAVIVIAAWLLAYSGAKQISSSAFTQLWMLPDAHQADILTVGIHNTETSPMRFKLMIRGDQGIYYTWNLIEIDRGKTWEAQYTLPTGIRSQKIEAWLYQLDQKETDPYRKVSYWYPASATPTVSANQAVP